MSTSNSIKPIANQTGMFSPFMFGLMMAVSVFSVLAMQWAKRDLARMEERRAERIRLEAQDMAKAVELSIRSETGRTFSQDFDHARLRQHTTLTQGKTLGKEEFGVTTRDSTVSFDLENQKVAIVATDDPLTRSAINRNANADDLANMDTGQNSLPIVVVDTNAIRQKQMLDSEQRLNDMAGLIFDFYAAHLKMPTEDQYDELAKVLNATDVWGGPFSYSHLNDDEATLEFTTPWQYTRTIKLNLKEE
ncbi:MAG: hypothetical protein WAX89_04545 [Alphaproteobacteria bacterium]